MPLVVSDASPLFVLAHLGRFDLLERFFPNVLVPPAVERELLNAKAPRATIRLGDLQFIRVVPPESRGTLERLKKTLDAGEAEAIALALETPGSVLLIDEYAGREAARANGLEVIGVLRLLMSARQSGLLPSLTIAMLQLQKELNFRISPPLFEQLRREAGEA